MQKKICFLLLFFCLCITLVKAQFNYNKLSIGLGVLNVNHAVVDYQSDLVKTRLLGSYFLGYNINPFESIDLHYQSGNLSGNLIERFGNVSTNNYREDTIRSFANAYQLLSVNYRFSLGRIIKNDFTPLARIASRISVSSGLGVLFNDVAAVKGERINAQIVTNITTSDEIEAFLPVRISYELKQGDRWRNPMNFFFSYQYLFTATDLLDGFDEGDRKEDTFGLFSVGMRFNVGKKAGFYPNY